MAAGLPILKLAGLLIKTVSKPISTRIKAEVSKFPRAARMCIFVGETTHQISSRITVFANGYRFIGAKPLPEDQALKDGVDFLSETVLFMIAGGILVVEYNKSEQKNALKAIAAQKKEEAEKRELERRFLELELELAELRASVLITRKRPFPPPASLLTPPALPPEPVTTDSNTDSNSNNSSSISSSNNSTINNSNAVKVSVVTEASAAALVTDAKYHQQ